MTQVPVFMIRNHPYQNVYFNFLAGRDYSETQRKYEMDYWGLSYRQLMNHLTKATHDQELKFTIAHENFLIGASLLPEEKRNRLSVCLKGGKYLLTNYRYQPFIEYREKELLKMGKLIYSVNVEGANIAGIYELNNTDSEEDRSCFSVSRQLFVPNLLGYHLTD